MEAKKVIYPLGTQDFKILREENFAYVDKTGLIYELVSNNRFIFLSRPRRFGKSLLLSTIRYYLEGEKELFDGLKIMDLEKKWTRHPVIHLELSAINPNEKRSFLERFEIQFERWEKLYGITNVKDSLSARFSEIIVKAYETTGQRVGVLIDEYDNPLINTIHNEEMHRWVKENLKAVYSNLKPLDPYVKFAFITGVSRFSKTSIFSGLNNLTDITFDKNYSTICGFSGTDIRDYLWDGVKQFAKERGIEDGQAMDLLKANYDGYHFAKNLVDVYNPYSLLHCLKNSEIKDYWFMSGPPEFLVRQIRKSSLPFKKLFHADATENSLTESDVVFRSPVALLYQTGYLTIKEADEEFPGSFRLGIPNREVERGLYLALAGAYLQEDRDDVDIDVYRMAKCLREGRPEEFLDRLKSFIAGIPYTIRNGETEQFFQRNVFLILKVLGLHVHTEFETSDGRIDILVETPQYLYVMELKADASANEALRQIESKDYALQWKHDTRKVFLIGVNFSTQTRNIEQWVIE